jgi:hypothetical protein
MYDLKRSALRAASRGYSIVPLHWATHGLCSCGKPDCSSVGKHPFTSHGFKDATTNESTISRWWSEYPDANIGVATGSVSNLIVLDVDRRHGGIESLKKFENENGRLPDGPAVRTGDGGFHLYFRCPAGTVRSRSGVLPGIDMRGDGGLVVYPPSIHKSGKRYRWLHDKSPKKVRTEPFPASLLKVTNTPIPSTSLKSESNISEGERNSTLTSLAGVMRSRGMTMQAIEAALLQDNSLRCVPPLPDNEVCSIARSVGRYPPGDTGILSATSRSDEKAERKLRFRSGKQISSETPVEVPWIVPPWVASGAITEIDGKVKLAGKTTLLTHMVNAVLNGRPFLGQQTARTKVVYLTEQNLISLRATMERASLLGRRDFIVLSWADAIGIPWPSVVSAVVNECKNRKAGLLVVDTLGQFAGLIGDAENNSGDALRALEPLQKAAATGLGVIVVRHERKSGGSVGDSGRGSSAFAGAVDVVMLVRRPEGNQARNVRLIQTVSRFDAPDELLIELTDEGYRALGAPGEVAKKVAAADLLSSMPKFKKKAATVVELASATGKSRAKVQQLLDTLAGTEELVRSGQGCKGDPYRYHKS